MRKIAFILAIAGIVSVVAVGNAQTPTKKEVNKSEVAKRNDIKKGKLKPVKKVTTEVKAKPVIQEKK